MCLYATYILHTATVPNTLAPKPGIATEADDRLFRHPYKAGLNYNLVENAVANGHYAQNGPHPSEEIVGMFSGQPIQKDGSMEMNTAEVKANATKDMPITVVHVTEASDTDFVGAHTQSHHYAYTTCENIGPCNPASDYVGSSCSGNAYIGGTPHAISGICYRSKSGLLQCGRAVKIDSRFGTGPKPLPYSSAQPSRCPAGIDLDYAGLDGNGRTAVARSLLIGGCMIPTDHSFKPTAMVHVPMDCTVPAHYQQGCMFPGARNYAPGSVEPGKCLYELNGCTSPTALNYNSEANHDDGSCVQPVTGCTLKAPRSGPEGAGRSVGQPSGHYDKYPSTADWTKSDVNMGYLLFSAYGNVKNPSASANVNVGCEIVIEGCTDPSAVNYNPKANSNKNTWCIPKVQGCMMPPPQAIHIDEGKLLNRPHAMDGGGGNYNPAATVHVKSMCSVGRLGCMSTSAYNYDPLATVAGLCYEKVEACFDPEALNFNCSVREPTPKKCITPDTWSEGPRGTVHADAVCIYFLSPPPIPSPSFPAGIPTTKVFSMEWLSPGTVEDYTEEKVDSMKTKIGAEVSVDASLVYIYITPASVKIDVQIEVPDDSKSDEYKQIMATKMSSASAASAFLGIPVISTPELKTEVAALVTPPAPPPVSNVGGLVGGIVGGIGGLLMAIGIGAWLYKKKKAKSMATYPA